MQECYNALQKEKRGGYKDLTLLPSVARAFLTNETDLYQLTGCRRVLEDYNNLRPAYSRV